jgi:hypothetical protein
VVLSAESPVNKWKDWLFFEVYSSKYAAAYLLLASTADKNREKGSLSAFSTYLAIMNGNGDFSRILLFFSRTPKFCRMLLISEYARRLSLIREKEPEAARFLCGFPLNQFVSLDQL